MITSTLLPTTRGVSFEGTDSSILRLSAQTLIQGEQPRNPQQLATRLAQQFIRQNKGILNDFGVNPYIEFDGEAVDLLMETGTNVGAIPLLSPTTGRPDYGLVLKPRFEWLGIGGMLGEMGWKVIPTPLKLPMLPRSERKIPPWILSTVILFRLQALLNNLERRFELTSADLLAPRGTVKWQQYVTQKIPRAHFLQVPCQFPDLRDDQDLKAAIHFTLRKQLASLETQRHAGGFVFHLIELCISLLERVRTVTAKQPSSKQLIEWVSGSFRTEVFREGLQAIEWTVDERGLAGLADLRGLPWILSMENFFEAWVETAVIRLSQFIGGVVHTGRKRETLIPLQWEPPHSGSQRYLLPDVILEREDETIIFDAKYKRHWEEIATTRWHQVDDLIQERHRQDILQILAYAATKSVGKVTCVLTYPCHPQTWSSLKKRGRLFHQATLPSESRELKVVLIAIPMSQKLAPTIQELISIFAPSVLSASEF